MGGDFFADLEGRYVSAATSLACSEFSGNHKRKQDVGRSEVENLTLQCKMPHKVDFGVVRAS